MIRHKEKDEKMKLEIMAKVPLQLFIFAVKDTADNSPDGIHEVVETVYAYQLDAAFGRVQEKYNRMQRSVTIRHITAINMMEFVRKADLPMLTKMARLPRKDVEVKMPVIIKTPVPEKTKITSEKEFIYGLKYSLDAFGNSLTKKDRTSLSDIIGKLEKVIK